MPTPAAIRQRPLAATGNTGLTTEAAEARGAAAPRNATLAVFFAALLATAATGQPTVYEGWDLGLAEGASALGFGGAQSDGFAGSGWTFSQGSGTALFDASGLGYTDMAGKSLAVSPGAVTISASVVDTKFTRQLASSITRPADFWVSYLLRLDSTNGGPGDAFWSTDGGADRGAFGFQSNSQLRFVNGALSGKSPGIGETSLVVAGFSLPQLNQGGFDEVRLYVDPLLGAIPATPDATFSAGASSSDGNRVRDAFNAIFKFNAQNNASYTIDELRIGDTFADVTPFEGFPELFLQIDTVYGEVSLINTSATPYEIAGYEMTSELGGLRAAGFVPLDQQDRPGFPPGDGLGNGWEVAGIPDSGFMAEQNLLGSSTLPADGRITLGAAYDTASDHRDVVFKLLLADNTVLTVDSVVYVDDPAGIPGDFDGDMAVTAADYTVWRDTMGDAVATGSQADANYDGLINTADYLVWRANYGNLAPLAAGLQAAHETPEPAASALLLIALAAGCRHRNGGALRRPIVCKNAEPLG